MQKFQRRQCMEFGFFINLELIHPINFKFIIYNHKFKENLI